MLDFMCGWTKISSSGLAVAVDALLFAQETQPAANAPAGGAAADGGAGRGIFGDTSFIWVMLAIGVLFYFLMMRPEQKQKARVAEMQVGLKKNDRVVTAGGIYGTVVSTTKGSDEVSIRIDESSNTKMRVERSSIRRVLSEDKKTTVEDKQESD